LADFALAEPVRKQAEIRMSVGIDETGSYVQALGIDDAICILLDVRGNKGQPASSDAQIGLIGRRSRAIYHGSVGNPNV
jgi:hypothetical protein